MGFFDFFEEANEQFKKDVSKAWDELVEDLSENSDSSFSSSSDNDSMFSDILRKLSGCPDSPSNGGFTGIKSPFERLRDCERAVNQAKRLLNSDSQCLKPVAGTPVYCKLAGAFEHTGIYIGNGEIAHLNGDGNIESVSPEEFCARLDGVNPTRTIYFAQFGGKALGKRSIADRAKQQLGFTRNYNAVFDNCHQFTCGCISGDFENPCNFFWMVEGEITDKLGTFTWEVWDY